MQNRTPITRTFKDERLDHSAEMTVYAVETNGEITFELEVEEYPEDRTIQLTFDDLKKLRDDLDAFVS